MINQRSHACATQYAHARTHTHAHTRILFLHQCKNNFIWFFYHKHALYSAGFHHRFTRKQSSQRSKIRGATRDKKHFPLTDTRRIPSNTKSHLEKAIIIISKKCQHRFVLCSPCLPCCENSPPSLHLDSVFSTGSGDGCGPHAHGPLASNTATARPDRIAACRVKL